MALSAANILLQITGDSSDGEKTLADISRNLALFAREEAEAEAYIDTEEAELELDELKAKLEEFKAEDATAEVNVKIAKAEANLAKLQAELDEIDHEDRYVDIDVKQSNVGRLAALSNEIRSLDKDFEGAEESANLFTKGLGLLGDGIGGGTLLVQGFAGIIAVALLSAVSAMIASFAEAVAGAGALAIALGATLPPAILLGIAAVSKFKDESDKAGTAAHALKGNVTDIWNAFKGATGGGANAVFTGLSDALRDIYPMVEGLRPAFTELGQAVGDAFRTLGKEFSSPYFQQFFSFITESLAELTPLFTRSFGALARILANIAQASMPFLISGFQQIAHWLESVAHATSNISELRDGVGGLVEQLKSWLEFGKALGNVFLGFLKAAAPAGKGFVDWLTKGAEAFAAWENSKSGREEIRTFFHEVLPIAKEAIVAFFGIAKVILQITEFFAPLVTAILHGFNEAIGVVSDFISWLQKVDRSIDLDELAGKVQDFVSDVAAAIGKPIHFVIGFADDLAGRARDLWQRVKGTITDRIQFVLNFAEDVAGRARDLWGRVRDAITDRIQFLLGLPDDLAGRARDIWGSVKGVITDAIAFLFSLPGDIVGRARDLWGSVKGVIADLIEFVLRVPNAVIDAAQAIWDQVKEIMSNGIDLVVHVVADLGSLPGKLADKLGFANGVKDLFSDAFALVGERGPELAFLPQGTDIYTAGETRNILKTLGKGLGAPAGVASSGGSGGDTYNHNEYNLSVSSPGTGSPDPDIALALLSQKLRTRGLQT